MQTFVVRLWIPAKDEGEEADVLRGVLERPGTVDSKPFRAGEELLELLQAGLAANLDTRLPDNSSERGRK